MGKLRDQLKETRFHCGDCDLRFDAVPGRIEDAPEDSWHPWRYFVACPRCKAEAPQERQARHLLKMWASASGPKTPEGKAASAANLAGHPTPEEARLTRFNALKHGLTARTATYWPARPGGYPHCRGCEYLDNLCLKQTACLKRTELMLKHHIAFETKDPALLMDLRAQLHGNVQAIIDDIVLAIAQDGVRLESPQWYYDREGAFHLAQYTDEDGKAQLIKRVEAHPLLKVLTDYIQKVGLTLPDQGMTPKVQEDNDVIQGSLAGQAQDRELLLEYQKQQADALTGLRAMIERSRDNARRDPVLIEHQQQEGEHG